MIEIQKIEIEWNHRWANSPEVMVYVGQTLSELDWRYKKIPEDADKNFMLLSTNLEPWVRYVYIAEPEGNPTYHGALGGTYMLESGESVKSRSGWSSRASVMNQKYSEYLSDYITEVKIKEPRYPNTFMHGYNLGIEYLTGHELWPKGVYLIKEPNRSEPHWCPSMHPTEVEKANAGG